MNGESKSIIGSAIFSKVVRNPNQISEFQEYFNESTESVTEDHPKIISSGTFYCAICGEIRNLEGSEPDKLCAYESELRLLLHFIITKFSWFRLIRIALITNEEQLLLGPLQVGLTCSQNGEQELSIDSEMSQSKTYEALIVDFNILKSQTEQEIAKLVSRLIPNGVIVSSLSMETSLNDLKTQCNAWDVINLRKLNHCKDAGFCLVRSKILGYELNPHIFAFIMK